MTHLEVAKSLLARLPAYKVMFSLEHNQHKVNYQTAESAISDWDAQRWGGPDWISEAEKAKAIVTDSIWEAQWYPETPVGSCWVAASSLEALLEYLGTES